MPAKAADNATPHLPVPSAAELAKRIAEARLGYAKREFNHGKPAWLYRNIVFDALLRRAGIFSKSEFVCVGEIRFDGCGPYLKILEAEFLNGQRSASGGEFWEKNFGNGAEVRHLDNPLGVDLTTPRTVIANAPGPRGRYLSLPARSDDRVVGYVIVALASEDYTPETAIRIHPVSEELGGLIEYLRAEASSTALNEANALTVREFPGFVFNCNNDVDRKINYIHGETGIVTGLRAQDCTSNGACSFASFIHDGDRERVAAEIARQLKEKNKYEIEYRLVRTDGATRHVYEQGTLVHDECSNQASVEGCVLDILETREVGNRSSDNRRRYQATIDKQLEFYIAEMESTVRAVRAKSEFVSNISHELRTPLHAILNYSKMGIANHATEELEAVKEYFERIQLSGRRLLSLINNLIDISNMQAANIVYKKSWCDLFELIEYSSDELSTVMKQKSLTLTAEVTAKNTSAICDKLRMIQVMTNLISNAIKFSSRGSDIRVCVADDRLPDGSEALCCSVADNGPGIPEGELEEVFDNFTQSSRTKTGAGGTGLGLAICREIVAAHGGRMWAENGKHKGAILGFVIPRSAGQ